MAITFDRRQPSMLGWAAQWLAELNRAERTHEVMRLVQDFVAMWPPEELSRIPPHCRPSRIRDANQVAELSYYLKREQLDRAGTSNEAEDTDLVERMMLFFDQAAGRLAKLSRQALH